MKFDPKEVIKASQMIAELRIRALEIVRSKLNPQGEWDRPRLKSTDIWVKNTWITDINDSGIEVQVEFGTPSFPNHSKTCQISWNDL